MSVTSSSLGGLLAGLLIAVAAPVCADSFTSSASSAGSASVGSASDSIQASSNSSSGDRQAAAGEYRVLAILQPAGRPDMQRLVLEPIDRAGDARPFDLQLPLAATADRPVRAGDRLRVEPRSYGLAVARAEAAQPFFLVLADERRRELEAHALTL